MTVKKWDSETFDLNRLHQDLKPSLSDILAEADAADPAQAVRDLVSPPPATTVTEIDPATIEEFTNTAATRDTARAEALRRAAAYAKLPVEEIDPLEPPLDWIPKYENDGYNLYEFTRRTWRVIARYKTPEEVWAHYNTLHYSPEARAARAAHTAARYLPRARRTIPDEPIPNVHGWVTKKY